MLTLILGGLGLIFGDLPGLKLGTLVGGVIDVACIIHNLGVGE